MAGFFYFSEETSKNDHLMPKNTSFTGNIQNMPLLENNLVSDLNSALGGGDIIIVDNDALLPDFGVSGMMSDQDDNENGQISLYEVREGDTVSQIAKMFNVSVNTIIWSNNIKNGEIFSGQILTILPISGIKYEVRSGDTIKHIVKKLNGDIDEIIKYNNLPLSGHLTEGQIIIIPNGEVFIQPSVSKSGSKPVRARGTNGPYYAGYYIRPIVGGRKSQDLHGYNGIDLAKACGTPVVASAGGDVVISRSDGWNGGYGKYVVVSHPNDTQTLYAHLTSNAVSAGWHVAQGQIIGYLGSTGNSTGCHVHFEIRGARNPW